MCGARRLRGEMGCPPQHPKVSQVPQAAPEEEGARLMCDARRLKGEMGRPP